MVQKFLEYSKSLYGLTAYDIEQISEHEGGRNSVFVCSQSGEKKYILRISSLGDKEETDDLAETEFVHYLAQNGAPVADVLPSINGRY